MPLTSRTAIAGRCLMAVLFGLFPFLPIAINSRMIASLIIHETRMRTAFRDREKPRNIRDIDQKGCPFISSRAMQADGLLALQPGRPHRARACAPAVRPRNRGQVPGAGI
jgi:hypothetical protein